MSAFHLYLSNRLELLLDELCDVLRSSPNDPLTPEIVVVQSRGMQRWLSLRLAEHFGVWANDEHSFPFPNAFIRNCFAAVTTDHPNDTRQFDPDPLSWRILGLLPAMLERPAFKDVRSYCGADSDALKRYQFARRLADLFDQYAVYRPDLLHSWESRAGQGDAAWQAELWQELSLTTQQTHKAALLQNFVAALRAPDFCADQLPKRVAVFGIPTLPPLHLAVFEALSSHIQVNLFLLNPSREYWGDILSAREAAKRKNQLSFEDYLEKDLYLGSGNPLLAALGAQGRDFFRLILDRLEFVEHQCFSDPEEDNLLHGLQSDILMLRDRPDEQTPVMTLKADDFSVQVHCCHGPLREMEVLYDQLLDLFQRLPDLTPDDVLVMIPDIEAYAPYISAVFEGQAHDMPRIPFQIADRGVRAQNALVQAFCNLLALPGSRFGAAQVLDVLENPAVIKRFGLQSEDFDAVRTWVREARIRWGMDAADRQRHGLPAYGENSWRAGLERLLLGYALPEEDGLFGDILPMDTVSGGDARPLGCFVDFIEALFQFTDDFCRERPLPAWADDCELLIDRFFMVDKETEDELDAIRQVLRHLRESSHLAEFQEPLPLEVVRAHLNGCLEQSGATQGFLTGGVTFGALLPMRSIPFRVIALAGMNDGAFPRAKRPAGFDLMARHPQPGDRSLRREDRYLFLEALVSARDCLLMTYVGQNQRDGSEAPPSVLVCELLDCIARGFRAAHGDILELVVRKNHLQAFHPAYFNEDSTFFSYSHNNCAALAARQGGRKSAAVLLGEPLPPPRDLSSVVDFQRLSRFVRHPQRFFLEERLGIGLYLADDTVQEREPFEIAGLERYQVMTELIEEHLTASGSSDFHQRFRARGVLPPGVPGEMTFAELEQEARLFVDMLRPLRKEPPEHLDLDVALGAYRLIGRLPLGGAEGPLRYRYARLNARDQLEAWIAHLACCAVPGRDGQTLLVGRDSRCYFAALGVEEARAHLEDLLQLMERALRQPLPFFPETSAAYASSLLGGKPHDQALNISRKVWEGNNFSKGEREDSWVRYAMRDSHPWNEEFCQLALRVFRPLLAGRNEVKL